MSLESGDFPVLRFLITVCISSSVAISIGVPSFSEFSSISFCNLKEDKDNTELKTKMVNTKRQLRSTQRHAEASLRVEKN
jgi:hypothetical protein